MSKRIYFADEDRLAIKHAVLKRKDVVENRKTDCVTLSQKKRAWDDITDEFNSRPSAVKRTTAQLKKLWDNIKFRRKLELGAERRERMRTGGGSFVPTLLEDPELDALGVDVEIAEGMDSDTPFLQAGIYEVVGDSLALVPREEESEVIQPPSDPAAVQPVAVTSSPQVGTPPVNPAAGRKRKRQEEEGQEPEVMLRITRSKMFIRNEEELHQVKMKAEKLKVELLELEIRQKAELYELKKQKLLAELSALQK